jgi:transaldolase / glucose-6-phosphate isomerase
MNPLQELAKYGQAPWLDYIRRSLITSGELKRHVDEDGLRGVTSNPSIFEKAMTGSADYKQRLEELQSKGTMTPSAIYEELAVPDIQDAADVLRPVYDASNAHDGYISLECSPYNARNTPATLDEARRLFKWVNRPNVMIKVPATPEGIPAIEQLISEGININVTLLFALEAYERVANAYINGIEKLVANGGDPSKVASVASFFISRIDALIEKQLAGKPGNDALFGTVAIANARITYHRFKELFSTPRWQALADKGAQRQRLLWASTGTKSPKLSDVLYVEELIGPETVNTMPPATMDAFRDHGKPRASLEEDVDGAYDTTDRLAKAGVSMKAVTDQLLVEGVKLFSDAFDQLLNSLDTRCKVGIKPKVTGQTYKLPKDAEAAVKQSLAEWSTSGKVRRLWAHDASLWTGKDEGQWLGWLSIADDQLAHADHLTEVAEEIKKENFSHVLLLGMGGSSLCPEVLSMTFGKQPGFPELHVLDSTDPGQIKSIESKIDISKTLFIVSSKSGSTLEPNIYKQYFFERAGNDGSRFIAITDPGSKMQQVAEHDKFRKIFFGLPSIGGRYSALSDFGMAPAAIMGLDVKKFLSRTEEMVYACSSCVVTDQNPGVVLGTILGTLAKQGKDKVTIIASPAIHDLGAWLEQLLAESTGKDGKGLIPVDREPVAAPSAYGNDRVFVYERFTPEPDAKQDAAIDAIEAAGHPVVRIAMDDRYDLGQEFFRWEIATAVAGSIIGINAFNQPDVEASKIETRKLTTEYEKSGTLPPETPIFEENGIKLFTDEKNAKALGKHKSLHDYLKAHLDRIGAGDYFALLAYIEMNQANEEALQKIRLKVRDEKKVATCLGFGPRFLHSTGQAYKGGPNSGVFLQITCDVTTDLAVPGQTYTFGTVKAAQARGDFEVLAARSRRALRIHLPADVLNALAGPVGQTLISALEKK